MRALSLLLLAACATPPAEPARPLPETVTSENAREVFEECLRRTTGACCGQQYLPLYAGVFNGTTVQGILRETPQSGRAGPWMVMEFAAMRKKPVNAGMIAGRGWAVVFEGRFPFGHGTFVYGTLDQPVTIYCPDGETAMKLVESSLLIGSAKTARGWE